MADFEVDDGAEPVELVEGVVVEAEAPEPEAVLEPEADDVPGISLAAATPITAQSPAAQVATAMDSLRTRLWAARLMGGPGGTVGFVMRRMSPCAPRSDPATG